MNGPNTFKEALIAEAIGDLARLLDRVDGLASSIDQARQALLLASTNLAGQATAFENRMLSITGSAQIQSVKHIVQRADQVARRSMEAQNRAMAEAAHKLFQAELESTLQRLALPLRNLADRIDRPWERWLTTQRRRLLPRRLPGPF